MSATASKEQAKMDFEFTDETIFDIAIGSIFGSLLIFGTFLEAFCSILFIFHIIKRTKYFCTAFFYILTIGFGFDLASVAMMSLGYYTRGGSHHDMVLNIGYLLYWYSMMILGPWNTLMALTRFTAVWFWKRHESIWSWKVVIGLIIGMFIYPFILSIHLLARDNYCYFHPADEKICEDFTDTALFVGTVSNGIHVIIAGILGIVTACASQCKIISVTSETKKFEQFLLFQSFLSLILYACHLSHTLTTDDNYDTMFKRIISNLSETYYTFFRISSALLLFFLSKTMRQSFFSFYKIDLLFCCCKKRKNVIKKQESTKINVATRSSISMMKVT